MTIIRTLVIMQRLSKLILITLFIVGGNIYGERTASQVIESLEDTLYGKNSSQSRVQILIKKPRTKRTLAVDSWEDRKGKKTFIRILKPKKDKGITFLKWDKNLWQYIPSIGKEIKIEGSLMQDSWMGSDFTNDDLVRSSSLTKDYEHSFLESKDEKIHKILAKPKPGTPVTWSKLIFEIRKEDLMPVKEEFYDHKNKLVRIQLFSSYKVMGGRLIPSIMKMSTLNAKGKAKSSTSMKYDKILFDTSIDNDIFSKANLRK
ncbi:MAG: outer membrane lipoprotein-sorting protein [Leptospiraceae bacterium]|nr:outer membrane lipoprotein-sorting protein [Leptospiraceae bacterium]MCP5493645.1 outer membrane lipoprotein-sorting protein [Leptospiraceae bacterium]